MFMIFAVAFVRHAMGLNATWQVLAKEFSAITIGIAFEDDKTGWTSHTDGSSAIQIVKTEDGGQSWKNVKNNTGLHLMMMGLAANKKTDLPITNVATTGLGASEYSLNGDDFKTSVLLQLISQDIDYSPVGVTGQMTIAGKNGPCVSKTGGALYECKKIPLKYKGTCRSSLSLSLSLFSHTHTHTYTHRYGSICLCSCERCDLHDCWTVARK